MIPKKIFLRDQGFLNNNFLKDQIILIIYNKGVTKNIIKKKINRIILNDFKVYLWKDWQTNYQGLLEMYLKIFFWRTNRTLIKDFWGIFFKGSKIYDF